MADTELDIPAYNPQPTYEYSPVLLPALAIAAVVIALAVFFNGEATKGDLKPRKETGDSSVMKRNALGSVPPGS